MNVKKQKESQRDFVKNAWKSGMGKAIKKQSEIILDEVKARTLAPVLIVKEDQISPFSAKTLRESFEREFGGGKNAGKAIILEEGMVFDQLSTNQYQKKAMGNYEK